MIAIIDYGMGNIHSVRKALEAMHAKTTVTADPAMIRKCDKLVLPGVGAFGDAMAELEKNGLLEAIIEHIRDRKLFLGICLGMHLLFDASEESLDARGLGIISGSVRRFEAVEGLKVPHMGWNQVKVKRTGCPLFKGFADSSEVYFCHSYYPQPKDGECIAATTEYGSDFASIIWKDSVFALQFHPEKSQAVGLKLLENFVNL